jgi:hypothetical protein
MRRLGLVLAASLAVLFWATPGASARVAEAKKPVPASAQLTFAGAAGLAGLAPATEVSCNYPDVDGSTSIFMLAQPADPTAVFNMHVTARKITVGVYSGSGTTFRGRDFEGTGVRGFNGAKGARIDATLTETTTSSENAGTLGAIMSIKGTVKCGSQTTGTSTVTYRGATADGRVSGKARPFRVECNTAPYGNSVSFPGVVKVGTTRAGFITTFTPDSINIFETIPGTPARTHHYQVKTAGVSTLSGTGATVSGDAVEQSPTSGTPHTVHVSGTVTCGSTIHRDANGTPIA